MFDMKIQMRNVTVDLIKDVILAIFTRTMSVKLLLNKKRLKKGFYEFWIYKKEKLRQKSSCVLNFRIQVFSGRLLSKDSTFLCLNFLSIYLGKKTIFRPIST